jgi:POT family proton-dependent oligopeptide transporter
VIYLLGILAVPIVWFWCSATPWSDGARLCHRRLAARHRPDHPASSAKTWVQRQRMILATVLIFGAVVFFTLFEQAGTSLNLFADRNVDLNLTSSAATQTCSGFFFGTRPSWPRQGVTRSGLWIDTTLTAAQTQSFNAGFILIFAPIFRGAVGCSSASTTATRTR